MPLSNSNHSSLPGGCNCTRSCTQEWGTVDSHVLGVSGVVRTTALSREPSWSGMPPRPTITLSLSREAHTASLGRPSPYLVQFQLLRCAIQSIHNPVQAAERRGSEEGQAGTLRAQGHVVNAADQAQNMLIAGGQHAQRRRATTSHPPSLVAGHAAIVELRVALPPHPAGAQEQGRCSRCREVAEQGRAGQQNLWQVAALMNRHSATALVTPHATTTVTCKQTIQLQHSNTTACQSPGPSPT